MSKRITIRPVTAGDANELLHIYTPYVTDTAISFEYEAPSAAEFAGRIGRTLLKYPYLAAERDGRIAGYAYASPFIDRRAYDRSAEVTIYIDREMRGEGCGRMLYEALEAILKRQNVTNLYACIAYTDHEDEYLTNASMRFHAHMGYRTVGTFGRCGYKFGRWYDMIWMEKQIGKHTDSPREFIPYRDLIPQTGGEE